MYSVFEGESKRRINLGGSSSAATHASILDQAKARRIEREQRKKHQDSAVRIQAWWRGRKDVVATKQNMRQTLTSDVTSITSLRCLVLLGGDDAALGFWSTEMAKRGEGPLFELANGPYAQSWLVLIRQAATLLLERIAESPESQYTSVHLSVLSSLFSPAAATRVVGQPGSDLTTDICSYALRHGLYQCLAKAVTKLCQTSNPKSSPTLPEMISLTTSPLSVLPSTSPFYVDAFSSLLSYILTIPLLLNKLPLVSLTQLSSRIPFKSFDKLTLGHPSIVESTSTQSKVHLIVNLTTLTQPRYSKMPALALDSYIRLLTTLFNSIPVNVLHPKGSESKPSSQAGGNSLTNSDSDSDDEYSRPIRVTVLNASSVPSPPQPPPLILDPRTSKRLNGLADSAHITSLLTASGVNSRTRMSLVAFLLALGTVLPAKKERMMTSVLVHSGGGLIREMYRGYVRGSTLGKDDDFSTLSAPNNVAAWPPLLFLADLYAQSLLTMGDDEFFGTSDKIAATHKNPLNLDELTSFSRQLLNIAFVLYWKDDQANFQEMGLMGDVKCSWEVVREKVTKCLVAIHARDSRKPFVPPGHWHVSSKIDMRSFIEAAVYEDQQISSPGTRAARSTISKRQVAYLSPRLGVLNNIPFAIPFETRVSIFRNFVANDMLTREGESNSTRRTNFGMLRRKGAHVTVRRDHVAQDGFDKLSEADLKGMVQITFIDQFGAEEAGIDGGGVFKEFFTSLCKEVFDTDRGLWLATKKNELYPNPHAYATESHSLNWYRFIGRILGKAMYEGILVDVAFAGFFLAKWLGKQSFLDDLASLDQDLYSGLVYLKHYTGNPEDLSLNFTVAVEEFGQAKSVDLIPNGSNIPVTNQNRLQYIHLVSHYRLSRQIRLQSEAFFEGLSELIDPKWLRMFNQQEVQILLGGVNSPVDLDDLRSHTVYGGLYDNEEATIVAFWNVVNSFDQEQRRALLRFVTSCSRPPLLGFKELIPNFAIRDAGSDEHRLPTSSTCVNLLKLPRYKSEKVLREKLLQAIMSGAGFDLS